MGSKAARNAASREAGGVGGELDAHEEEAELDILMLVGVEDVDVVASDEKIHDGGDDSLAVGTVDEQDGDLGIGHCLQSKNAAESDYLLLWRMSEMGCCVGDEETDRALDYLSVLVLYCVAEDTVAEDER